MTRTVVVAFQKSGTNLVARLFTEAGYAIIGHGIRASLGALAERLGRTLGRVATVSDFLDTAALFDVLEREYEERTCLFLHGLPLGPALQNWSFNYSPQILYHYRDPRSQLVSLIHYLLGDAKEAFTGFYVNKIHSDVLRSLHSIEERIDYALGGMSDWVEAFRSHYWLLYHPRVCKTSFEELVGVAGGGSEKAQLAAVSRAMEFIGSPSNPARVAEKIFSKDSRTFRNGQIDEWRTVMSARQIRRFDDLFGDVLDRYGYRRGGCAESNDARTMRSL